MNGTLTWTETLRKRRPLWLAAAASVAALATIIAIAVSITTGGAGTKPTLTRLPAQAGTGKAATCAPDDSLPVGPGGDRVPACP